MKSIPEGYGIVMPWIILPSDAFHWMANPYDPWAICRYSQIVLWMKWICLPPICGATVFMANNGYLDSIEHTSNALPYLQKLAPNYKGEKLYQNQPCVTGGNIITANGAAMIEFAIAIFNKFKVAEGDLIEKIRVLHKSGGMDYRF